jgi:hypothetical protein
VTARRIGKVCLRAQGTLVVIEVLFVLAVLVLFFVPAGIVVAKGHILLFFAGFLVSLVWPIAAFRLAKPNSPWARRYYGSEKLARSKRRYPEINVTSPSRVKLAAAIGFGLVAATFIGGLVVGLAE